MRRIVDNGFLRGLLIVAAVSLAIVVLSLEESLVTAGALMRIAFFLAIAFFLFLLWRERRAEIDTWSDLSKRTFYGAVLLAVVSIGVYVGVGANGRESLAFVAVLVVCGWTIFRVWRRERSF